MDYLSSSAQSTFYTSNPLLYFSHLSDIAVATDLGVHQPGGDLLPQQLSGRRELVEQLDPSEPLIDYLVRNGVLERPLVNDIKNEKSPAKVNLALLKHVESSGKPAVNLFVNALRQTGQHNLASLLDDTARIKALSGSGYLSKSRHKGQLSLQIQVHALRLPGESFTSPTLAPSRNWVSLDDIMLQMNVLRGNSLHRQQVQQFEIVESPEMEDQKASCLCGCFSKLFSRKKSKKTAEKLKQKNMAAAAAASSQQQQPNGSNQCSVSNGGKISQTPTLNNRTSLCDRNSLRPESFMSEADLKLSVENLENVADCLRTKSEEFYTILRDTSSSIYTDLLKYFEQSRGVLVLATSAENGFEIVNIFTKADQLEEFRRDHSSGKLDRDVENFIVTDNVLERIGVLGMRLVTKIDQDEMERCQEELGV